MKVTTQDDILQDLNNHLSSYFNVSPLFGQSKNTLSEIEDSCVKYLKALNYKVSKKPSNSMVLKVEDLVNYFYSLSEFYHGECCILTSNRKKDNAMVSRFAEQRMGELNCTLKEALIDCSSIMEGLFLNEKELGLDRPIGLWVFGTDKCKWITDKVVGILNNNYKEYNENKAYRLAEEWSNKEAENYTGFDIEEIRTRRKLNG